jgi:hypothetical protein
VDSLRIGESIMQLEWRTFIKDNMLGGWRLYDVEQTIWSSWRILATVRLELCETKQPMKLWRFKVESLDKGPVRWFDTEEDAKAFAIAMVRL